MNSQNENKYYNMNTEQVLHLLNSSKDGLASDKIDLQAQLYGKNNLGEEKKEGIFKVFLLQFKDLLVFILILAAILSMVTGNTESSLVILTVLILNALLGTIQYLKASKSLASLKALSSPMAKVIRDGHTLEIKSDEVVVGDIILLEAGDIVPADGRIIESSSLQVNESHLTGESVAVSKIADEINKSSDTSPALGDQLNMVFSGSLVTYGKASAVITAVGMGSELGKIAGLMKNTKERKTPLQKNMDSFSTKLSIAIVILSIIVFFVNYKRGMVLTDALLFAVALAVAAIPEALASIITISLSIGTGRMAKEKAIIKKLSAVEGLGSVSIICSDKTGTLTQNKMTVTDVYSLDKDYTLLLTCSILCNDAILTKEGLLGDPTETALIAHYMSKKDNYEHIKNAYPAIDQVPFDSDRKLMSSLHEIDGEDLIFTKGAPDVLISRCSGLSEKQREEILKQNDSWSSQGLRVLAFAYKKFNGYNDINFDDEYELSFLGLIAEIDPPRDESKYAVQQAIKAGITPIMITGDHKVTATAIAKSIGIFRDGNIAITGTQLDEMSDEELYNNLEKITVYARVSPENKIRIVKAWQKLGKIVAMTGDGVNDAPALKRADVGIAMGITGTEVSKDASSMILADDNFATIISAVLSGRNIYENIKKSIIFLLSGNMAGILMVLYATILGLATPFTAVHLLFINLVTDSMPALAISMEPVDPTLLNRPPRPSNEGILNTRNSIGILIQGILISLATFSSFYYGLSYSNQVAMTMSFATLCLARLIHGFDFRGSNSIFTGGILKNIFIILAFIVGFTLLAAILFLRPLWSAFNVSDLPAFGYAYILIMALIPAFIIQCYKLIISKKDKN